ncbi:MAG: efflux RND transporter periplasmic adaptor subunit [Desulfovibrionales bacterium]
MIFRSGFFGFFAFAFILFLHDPAPAQQDPRPALVVVSESEQGLINPTTGFVGTIYFAEVSQVAAELSGLIMSLTFEEGRPVQKNAPLVRLNSELLETKIHSQHAQLLQVRAQLESEQRTLSRMEQLFQKGNVSEQEYDLARFNEMAMSRRAESLEADLQRLKIELRKSTIAAPFQGIVLERHVSPGEWVNPGDPVATIADTSTADVIVNIPEAVIPFVGVGSSVIVQVRDSERTGVVHAVIPLGDESSRTIPVKIRVHETNGLAQGMQARVFLPTGPQQEAIIVPRDALISRRGQNFIYAAVDGAALMIPVQILGYQGNSIGVSGEGLQPGLDIVIKGNERLQPGQPVQIVQ